MARPKGGYALPDGTKVPGVTTILNRFKESGGLIYWAWSQGKAGKDFREERDKAADAGTLAHSLVEATLQGEPLDPLLAAAQPQVRDAGWKGYQNWLTWVKQTKLEVKPWEQPLVCEHYRYGGTPDAFLTLDGKTVVGDWKTSSGASPYLEHLMQVAAYRHLFEDAGHQVAEGYHLCIFSREAGDFHHHYFSELAQAWEMFRHLREAFDLGKALEKRIG